MKVEYQVPATGGLTDTSLEPTMTISGAESMSGEAIATDLCDRIWQRLAKSDSLRSSDSYRGYTAQIKVTLQLLDFDTVTVREEMAVGALCAAQDIDLPQPVDVPSIDPKWPTEEIMIDAEVAAEQESTNLERPIDPVGFEETQEVPAMKRKVNKPTKEKRWHPPHNRLRPWPPFGS